MSLWFRGELPPTINALAGHDDALFLRQADSLRAGEWLGPFDTLTLAKGPGYPAFLAIAAAGPVPLKLLEHATYLGGAALMALVTARLSGQRWLGVGLYTVLATNPIMWSPHLARVIRDGLYTALGVMIVAGLGWLLLVDAQRCRVPSNRRGIVVSTLIGATIGVYWLTRQEGVWLVPAAVIVGVGAIWTFPGTGLSRYKHAIRPLVLRSVFIAAGFGLVLGASATLTAQTYGMPLLNDFIDGSFPAAYGALTRIDRPAEDRYVPVSESARRAAYGVSSAAAELEPYLEGDVGATWTSFSCDNQPRRARCDDMRGGWFSWALREAIAQAGHWKTLPQAQAFMRQIAAEVNAACDRDQISCGPPRATTTPPVGIGTVIDALAHVPAALSAMTGSRTEISFAQSIAEPDEMMALAELYGPFAPVENVDTGDSIRIEGWLAAIDPEPINVETPGSSDVATSVRYTAAPDVRDFLASLNKSLYTARRFELVSDCSGTDCYFVVGDEFRAPIGDVGPGRILHTDSLWVHVDRVAQFERPLTTTLHVSRNVYATLLPVLGLMGVAGTSAAVLRTRIRRRHGALIILAIAAVSAVLTRSGLIALIEVTSWPGAITDGYLAPAAPFLLVFVVLGMYLAVLSARELIGSIRIRRHRTST